ncbi:activating signal cointegrator 1 complex subunit 2-like protein [Abeliophyllum distichum]|uniref:Activating signal cointegrator 1 complex subunit 2-like protein n=1 Tax=Abeliophyllum distichum TaxID=126358 RepID=A0ABD1SYI5_9LAMI
MFDRLEVGSSIAPSQPAHSRRSENREARTKKKKGPKHSLVEPEEEKERLECYEDDDDENLPFTNDLKAIEIPVNFQMPIMDKYNRRSDPSDHINIYKTKIHGQSSTVKCQNFHTTIISDAKRCYNKLKLGSI